MAVQREGTDVLRWRRERGQIEAESVGERASPYVFSSVRPAGRGPQRVQPLRQDTVRGVMARICKQAGVLSYSPHALRHTWTSLLAAQGENVATVSKQVEALQLPAAVPAKADGQTEPAASP